MAISKIRLNGVTKMDVTGTTATVSDVASGKVFTQVDGTTGMGTASGMPYLEYWGDISVFRQGNYVQPTFPVVAGRCIVAFCLDEKDTSTKEYVILFATYNADGTRYSYGALSEEDGRSIQTNYGVTEGAEYMTPARYVAFPNWMEDYTLTAPAYIIVNSKKDED